MKSSLYFNIIFWCMLSILPLYGQLPDTPAENILIREQLVEDYSILYSSLVNYHPYPFRYTSEEGFNLFFQNQLSELPDSLSDKEFHLITRELIAELKCGHTYAKPSEEWYNSVAGKNVLLPFDVDIIGGEVYVGSIVNEEFDFSLHDRLLSLNGIPMPQILEKMSTIQERDGLTQAFVREILAKKFRTYYLFIYGTPETVAIQYQNKAGEIKETSVKLSNKRTEPALPKALPSQFNVYLENNWSSLSIDSTTKIACFRLSSFSDRKEFKAFYEQAFGLINEANVSELIIDLRGNSGGYFEHANKFLTYLTAEKFAFDFHRPKRKIERNKHVSLPFYNKLTKLAFSMKPGKNKARGISSHTFTYKPARHVFQGNINVVTNGLTFSFGALVAAHLKQHGAHIYGTETGGVEAGTSAMLNHSLVLPHSGIQVGIPYYFIVSNAENSTFGYGVMPDTELSPGNNLKEDEVLRRIIRNLGKD